VRHQDFRNSRRRDFDADDIGYPQPRAFGTRPRFDRAAFESPSGPPVSGVVKWFNPGKGFGFVALTDGSGDGFLHATVLARSGISAVQPGETLKVRVGPGHTGPHITEVLSVDTSTATPMTPRQPHYRRHDIEQTNFRHVGRRNRNGEVVQCPEGLRLHRPEWRRRRRVRAHLGP
jgi:cold shock protein